MHKKVHSTFLTVLYNKTIVTARNPQDHCLPVKQLQRIVKN